jgi:pimeloyl-ACP methyl ester carboxylesterase
MKIQRPVLGPTWRRIVYLLVFVITGGLILFGILYVLKPSFYVNHVCANYAKIRRIALAYSSGATIRRLSHFGKVAERIEILKSPSLIGDYYPASDSRPLILLVHGLTSDGRRFFPYPVLASRLSADGFPVLAIDLRGFGESAGPVISANRAFNFEDDVLVAVKYAVERELAQPGRIVYVGHSLGALIVLRAEALEPRPASVVVLGTPFPKEWFEKKEYFGRRGATFQRLWAEDILSTMGIRPDQESVQVMERYLRLSTPITRFLQEKVPPILFVYGERESIVSAVSEIRNHRSSGEVLYGLHIVPDAGHTYNINKGPWGLVIYDEQMLNSVASTIEGWAIAWDSKASGSSRSTKPE